MKHFTLADILLRIEKEKLKDLDRTAKQQRRVVIDYAKHLGCPEEALEDREFYNRMRLESLVKYHARRLLSEYACSYGDFRPARKDRRAIARTIHDHLLGYSSYWQDWRFFCCDNPNAEAEANFTTT